MDAIELAGVSRGDFIDIGGPDDYVRAHSELVKVCR